ncbi:redoxin domain-containing protein [Puniceicoccaceae bacterium K14]|nr:redoxin domain-containing protein [Puniceicoccaceae bacterium K14]
MPLLARRFAFCLLLSLLDVVVSSSAVERASVAEVESFEERALVLFFVSEECPIANRYVPRIKSLHEKYSKEGVSFKLVYANGDSTEHTVETHRKEFSIPIPALIDPEHVLVEKAKVSVTPECAVFVHEGQKNRRLVYHGRIDDQYVDFGKWRQVAGKKDLNDVLTTLLQGEEVTYYSEKAIGCYITR